MREQRRPARRRFIAALPWSLMMLAAETSGVGRGRSGASTEALRLFTFGDSVLDCAHYNDRAVHPGQLLVRNDDRLFPEFRGQDLESHGAAALEHRAVDGATVGSLDSQAREIDAPGRSLALLTVGGNDLIRGLAADSGAGLRAFERVLDAFLAKLPIRPVLLGTVYDPTFGDDSLNFLGVDARIARANHRRVNRVIASLAARHGTLVDLHAHFLGGDPSWFTRTIEPSLVGASEIRRAFLQGIRQAMPAALGSASADPPR